MEPSINKTLCVFIYSIRGGKVFTGQRLGQFGESALKLRSVFEYLPFR